MKRLIEGWLTALPADAPASLREFLQALLDQPQHAPYDDYTDALRWCIDKLGQGEPNEEKQRVRQTLVNLRVHLGVLLANQCLQDLLQKHIDAGRTDLLEIPNTNAYDLSRSQLQEAWRKLNPPSLCSPPELELTLEG